MGLRDTLPEYFSPTPADFARLWDAAHFVFDTNVLLLFLKLSRDYSKEFMTVASLLQDRIWFPHQVAKELARNLPTTAHTLRTSLPKLKSSFNASKEELLKILDSHLHPILNREAITQEIERSFERIDGEISRSDKENELTGYICDQTIVLDALMQRIGQPYDGDRMKKIFAEGRQRYEKKIPPGFADQQAKRDDDDRLYGDLTLWLQTIDYAKDARKPIIMVTEDQKEDWWWIVGKRTTGPHYLLRREMFDAAGQQFYLYRVDQFLQHASKTVCGRAATPEVISELRRFRDAELRAEIEQKRAEAQRKRFMDSAPARATKSHVLRSRIITSLRAKGSVETRLIAQECTNGNHNSCNDARCRCQCHGLPPSGKQ